MPVEIPTLAVSGLPAATSWWRRTVSAPAAAGAVGATVLVGGALLTVAHAWTERPKPLAELTHVIGGVIVALSIVAAFAIGTQTRALRDLVAAAALGLAAHGTSLLIQGAPIGALFVAFAPLVAFFARLAFISSPMTPSPPTSDRIDIAWAIAKSRQKTADAARRAASPSHLVMRA